MVILLCLGNAADTYAETKPPQTTAAQLMSQPRAEDEQLARLVGTWDVVATLWPAPGAQPVVTKGLVAERRMLGGTLLQEIMRPARASKVPDFWRIDYLNYDRVEGRWKYVSLDTRFPVSVMPAWSWGGERDGKLTLYFEPLGFVGFGKEVEGRLSRSDMVITRPGPDRDVKQQHFIQANGTGTEWLFTQYEYTRRADHP